MAKRSPWLGILALTFFLVHEALYIRAGHPENALWSCNVAVLGIGVGLFIPSALSNAVGTFWLIAGLPIWIYYLATATNFIPTSVLTHLGGLIIGLAGIRRLGVPRLTLWVSIMVLPVLILITRPLTRPADDINFSYGAYPGIQGIFSSDAAFMSALSATFIGIFAVLQWSLPRLALRGPRPDAQEASARTARRF